MSDDPKCQMRTRRYNRGASKSTKYGTNNGTVGTNETIHPQTYAERRNLKNYLPTIHKCRVCRTEYTTDSGATVCAQRCRVTSDSQAQEVAHGDSTIQIRNKLQSLEEERRKICATNNPGEPRFKYRRIMNDVPRIFAQDAASCMCVHERFLVIGTQWGRVYVLDHMGNQLRDQSKKSAPALCFTAHTVSVNEVCIDRTGEYIVSCANDGKICIMGIEPGAAYAQEIFTGRPVRSIDIEAAFAKSTSRQLIASGDRALCLHERGMLGKSLKRQVVYTGFERDGLIHRIACSPHSSTYIAFANDTGVRLYDRSVQQLITHVQREHDLNLRCELYPAHLTWTDTCTLLTAWANHVSVSVVRGGSAGDGLLDHVTTTATNAVVAGGKFAELRQSWTLPPRHFCAGVLPVFDNDDDVDTIKYAIGQKPPDRTWSEIALMIIHEPHDGEDENEDRGQNTGKAGEVDEPAPDTSAGISAHVWLVRPVTFNQYELITDDIIEMRDVLTLRTHQYRMKGIPMDSVFYLLATRDLIEVRPSSADDHIEWLLTNEHFDAALAFAKNNSRQLKDHTLASVGNVYLQALIDDGQMEAAATLAPEVCGTRKDAWEQLVSAFDQQHCAHLLCPVLPTQQPQLEPECYECVLIELLRACDGRANGQQTTEEVAGGGGPSPDDALKTFCRLVHEWPPDVYRVAAVIAHTLERIYAKGLPAATHNALLIALAQLYTYERNYQRALHLYLSLRHRSVFALINRYQLFPQIVSNTQQGNVPTIIPTLMDIDTDLCVRLLLDNEEHVPPRTVIRVLHKQPRLQLAYLQRLMARNDGGEFADLAVTLYAEHDAQALLPFLRRDQNYSLEQALGVCQRMKLMKEVVFLLGRAGNRADALRTIIEQLNDIQQAVEFCKEHDEHALWNQLVAHAIRKPDALTTVLRTTGSHVPPGLIIAQIPAQMRVPALRESLVKIMHDYERQIQFQVGLRKGRWKDCVQDGCRRVTLTDTHELMRRLVDSRRRGVRVDHVTSVCALCERPLAAVPPPVLAAAAERDVQMSSNVHTIQYDICRLYLCAHVCHYACALSAAADHAPSAALKCHQCARGNQHLPQSSNANVDHE